MVEDLNPPKFDVNADLKKDFYESQGHKYGLNILHATMSKIAKEYRMFDHKS